MLYITNSCSYGGAIMFTHSNVSLQKCNFVNNMAYSYGRYKYYSYGGAISFISLSYINCITYKSFNECTFNNNTVSSCTNSYGGAIYSNLYEGENTTFLKLTFINNTAYSKSHSSSSSSSYSSDGGAIYTTCEQNQDNNTFIKSIFYNNSAYSSSYHSNGGAISFSYLLFNAYSAGIFNDCVFMNNQVYSNSSSAEGGAIIFSAMTCSFTNCTFENNIAETFLNIFQIQGDEPHSYGGAICSTTSRIYFTECKFINNTGYGNSPFHVSTGKGGALYSAGCNVQMNKTSFKNNTLIHFGRKFDIDCYIEGGGCYFSYSQSFIFNCTFINNTATLRSFENSTYFSPKIIGGSLYFIGKSYSLNCTNCIFNNNLVHIPNHREKEFSGAIYLTNGLLNCCKSEDNVAYNGGDITYIQNSDSLLRINYCYFKHNTNESNQIKSLIYYHINQNISLANIFANNKIEMNSLSYCFDGEIESENTIIKIKFTENCISPFDKRFYKSNKIIIYNENGNETLMFESAFKSSCDENIFSQTIKPIFETDQIKTQDFTQYITFLTEIEYIKSQTPELSFITQTESINSKTQTVQLPIITHSDQKINKTIPTLTQTEFRNTKTKNFNVITQTEQINTEMPTQTDSFSLNGYQLNIENKKLTKIIILLIVIIAILIVIILLIIGLFILIQIKKVNRNDLIEPLIDID